MDDRVRQFYARQNPSKLDDVESIVERYALDETLLCERLIRKYIRPRIAARRILLWNRRRRVRHRSELRRFYRAFNPIRLKTDKNFVERVRRRYGVEHRDLLHERLLEKYVNENAASRRIQRFWRARRLESKIRENALDTYARME